MIVIDASAMLEWLLQTPAGAKIEQRTLSVGGICAPHLIDLEVTQSVRKMVRLQQLTPIRGQEILDDLLQVRLNRYSHYGFLPRIWKLRHSCTAYDAMYIALAESLPGPLITRDQKLASSHGHSATIELF